jgi:hypothetical protein
MSDDPKTALEIAMERLHKQDSDRGVVETPLTDQQRKAIAEARSISEAKLAQAEIMHRSKTIGVFEPELREKIDAEYRRDVRHIVEDRDRALEKIRGGA